MFYINVSCVIKMDDNPWHDKPNMEKAKKWKILNSSKVVIRIRIVLINQN